MSMEDMDQGTKVGAEAGPGEAPGAEMGVATEMLKKAAEAGTPSAGRGTAAEGEEMRVKKLNLKTLARELYQMGLDLGLTPDEAALLTSEMELPFIGNEGEGDFESRAP
jgi:hypothetical protein